MQYPSILTDQFWVQRVDHLCGLGPRADLKWAVVEGYMEWYRQHSHPLVVDPQSDLEPRARDRVQEGVEVC